MMETMKLTCGHSREVPPLLAEAARFWGAMLCPECMTLQNLEDEEA